MSGHQSLHHTPQPLEFSFAHAALHCGQSERATSRASRACSSSLILRSSEQLPQAVRTDQCRTKEGCYPEPRKRPELVLDAQGRHYATKEGHDARRHKQLEIVKRARSNGALHQVALHCGQSERVISTGAALCGLSASGEVVVKRTSFRLQHLRRLRRFYKLQFHYAAGRCAAIRLDNPLVAIIKGKACLSFYRCPHHLAELVYAVWFVVALYLRVQLRGLAAPLAAL